MHGEYAMPKPPPDWVTRPLPRVVCARCGTPLADLGFDHRATRDGEVDVWGLFPVPGQARPEHPGKTMQLVCPRDRHAASVKASTLGAQFEHDHELTVLRV